MQVFYSNKISNSSILIDGQEHIHLSKVLRKTTGDIVAICDGKGLMVNARIISSSKKETILNQTAVLAHEKTNANKLILAVAPTKSMDRFEWMVEKCTEIGVNKIIPFYSHHSERRRLKVERLRLIAISAMKQSKHLFLPEIMEPVAFKDLLGVKEVRHKYMAYMDEHTTQIASLLPGIPKKEDVLIAIGPEGGFSDIEVTNAKNSGFSPISLGSSRLRTETAAMLSAAAYQLL